MKILEPIFKIKKRRYDFHIASRPMVRVPEETFTGGYQALHDVLESNLMAPVGGFSDIWARPAPKFPAPYLWDSSFISQAWKWWDPAIGLRILKPFVEFQDEAGRMPHQVFWGKHVSKLSNPPFLAWAVNSLLNHVTEAKNEWLDYFLEPLHRFVAWRKEHRQDKCGLYYWIDSYESGIDNSPRFRSVDEKEDYGVKNLGAIDLNAEILLQLESILSMHQKHGKDGKETDQPDKEKNSIMRIESIKQERDALLSLVEGKLWDEKMEIYGDLDLTTTELNTVDTIASYFPLACNGINKERMARLIERIEDTEKYNSLVPLPTVSLDSPYFLKDMWRGPVWMNTAYLIIHGLQKQGHGRLAGSLAYRLCKGVYDTWKNEGNFYEFYDPNRYDIEELHRKKGNLFKAITLGRKPVKHFAGWTADANAMLVEHVIGLSNHGTDWMLEPHIPRNWEGSSKPITLSLPYHSLEISMAIEASIEEFDVSFSIDGKAGKTVARNHERVALQQ